LRKLDDYEGTLVVRCALALAPQVFVRPGELRKAYSLHCAMCGSHYDPDQVPPNTEGQAGQDAIYLLCKNPDDEGICRECMEQKIFPTARKLREDNPGKYPSDPLSALSKI
jgi:hypothetical protein